MSAGLLDTACQLHRSDEVDTRVLEKAPCRLAFDRVESQNQRRRWVLHMITGDNGIVWPGRGKDNERPGVPDGRRFANSCPPPVRRTDRLDPPEEGVLVDDSRVPIKEHRVT